MKILFISAFYPPYIVGGWEQLVQDINVRLQERGHTTRVLTSTHGVDAPRQEPGVDRLLSLESDLYHYRARDFLDHKKRLRQNLAHTRQTITDFEPDVIFIHVMWNLSPGIAWQAEQLCPGRVVYYVANDWPHALDPHTAYWQDPAQNPLLNAAKRLLAPWPVRIIRRELVQFPLQFEKVLCVSHAVKKDLAVNANIPPENMAVVYNGVEIDLFTPPENGTRPTDELKLLYAGSLVDHKGVHTAVEAMALLAENPAMAHVSLSIAGGGHPDYEARLRQRVEQAGLQNRVHFLGRIPREQMPGLLQRHHVLVFPSIWEEPLARMTQEAMATEMTVVSTLTGGTGELVIEGETGLTFPPDDATVLAQRVAELAHHPNLRVQLAKQGRAKVLAQFDLNRMIDEIEIQLSEAK